MNFAEGAGVYLGVGALVALYYTMKVHVIDRRRQDFVAPSASTFAKKLSFAVALWPVAMFVIDE